MFKVKTLAVLFSPYPREMKHIPRNLNLPPFWRLLVSIEVVQSIPTRALSRGRGLSMRTHLTAVGARSARSRQNVLKRAKTFCRFFDFFPRGYYSLLFLVFWWQVVSVIPYVKFVFR